MTPEGVTTGSIITSIDILQQKRSGTLVGVCRSLKSSRASRKHPAAPPAPAPPPSSTSIPSSSEAIKASLIRMCSSRSGSRWRHCLFRAENIARRMSSR